MEVSFSYDHRTQVLASPEWVLLDYAANTQRPPVSFAGRVREPLLMRQLLTALHRVIVSDARQPGGSFGSWILDPVITVHPDQLFFEAFSSDQSVYARLSAPLAAFDVEEGVQYGTTNVDFTWALRETLQNLRSSRRTVFQVGTGGFGVDTQVGAVAVSHFERKVDVPESWLKGFLQVQSAFALQPFWIDVQPVDLLTVITFMQEHKPPRPPYGLRFEFVQGEPFQVVLEPWNDQPFTLGDKTYDGYDRTVRVWGRRRLELLTDVLPYAHKVTVGLLGRGLPHLYLCHCGPFVFTLVLSGWTRNDWSVDSAFDALIPQVDLPPGSVEHVHHYLSQHFSAPAEQIGTYTDVAGPQLEQALFQLCRAGRVIFDPSTRRYRLRELFDEPLDVQKYFRPNPHLEQAQALAAAEQVTLHSVGRQQERPETRATGAVAEGDEIYQVIASVDDNGRLRFGRCQCPFFDTHLMSRGPCPHILAVRLAMEEDWERLRVGPDRSAVGYG